MGCSHTKKTKKIIKKEIFDLEFSHKTLVCNECGAYLRGDEYEEAYMLWLEKIYKDRRDKFQVQCHISSNVIKCMDQYLKKYPGVSQTVFMRSLVIVYLNFVDVNQKLAERFNKVLDKEIYASFESAKKIKKSNIQFKPKMMLDLVAISETISMRPHQIVEQSISKMMTAIASQDETLKAFWEKEIKGYLDVLLKAA